MSVIGSSFGGGFDPSQMMQQMKDRFKTADIDGSGSVSKAEFVKAGEESGLQTTKMDNMFSRMDSNGDGEVSQEEHQAMLDQIDQRITNLMGDGDSNSGFDAVMSLMQTLQDNSGSESEKQQLEAALEKMRSEGNRDKNISESLSLINNIIPGVNTWA